MGVDQIGAAIAYGAFYLIVVTLLLTWIIELALRPRTRQEWAEFAKITAFNLIVLRQVWTIWTGHTLPAEVAMVFWSVCFLLVAFFLAVLLDDWGPPFVRLFCAFCLKRRRWLIPAGVALVIAAVIYAFFWL